MSTLYKTVFLELNSLASEVSIALPELDVFRNGGQLIQSVECVALLQGFGVPEQTSGPSKSIAGFAVFVGPKPIFPPFDSVVVTVAGWETEVADSVTLNQPVYLSSHAHGVSIDLDAQGRPIGGSTTAESIEIPGVQLEVETTHTQRFFRWIQFVLILDVKTGSVAVSHELPQSKQEQQFSRERSSIKSSSHVPKQIEEQLHRSKHQ